MHFVFNPDTFVLGLAVGVLGLVLLLSLVVSYAYDEGTLLFLAAYLAVQVIVLLVGERLQMATELIQRLLLVVGPALLSGLQMWLFRKRINSVFDKVFVAVLISASLGLMGFYAAFSVTMEAAAGLGKLPVVLALVWGGLMGTGFIYRGIQALETAGPWKWWLMLGHAGGLLVSLLFLTDVVDAMQAYWPVVLMLLVQVPPVYLSLVWRSRLLNESRLRSAAASVTDPLTGLVTTPVLIERVMRIMSRAQNAKQTEATSALFLIEVQNWNGLLNELGVEFNEKLLLEAALRLRRSIGDNDLVARIKSGRFAVVAQGLGNEHEITGLATRLVVSGLRIDSPLLPGVELKFRVIVRNLKLSKPFALPEAEIWLSGLTDNFSAWPGSHRSRSILVVADAAEQQVGDSLDFAV
ncbi:MAG: diguanylate cyclase [Polaromonas sp.]|nr:diguanylate cyclase [Polaromonas sp.]